MDDASSFQRSQAGSHGFNLNGKTRLCPSESSVGAATSNGAPGLPGDMIENLLHAMSDIRESVVRFGHELVERESYSDPERIERLARMLAEGGRRTDAWEPEGDRDRSGA